MLICDIGNTTLHFKEGSHTFKVAHALFDAKDYQDETVYYICVQPDLKKELSDYPNWIDISTWVVLEGSYPTLGIDRKLAAWYLEEGVVVDAGSAITVDCMKASTYQGGFIYPGFPAMQKAFADISDALDYSINFELSLDTMPLTSQDAISYGALVPLIEHIKNLAQGKRLVITGGDANKLMPFFNAELQEHFLFDAMQKLITQHEGDQC